MTEGESERPKGLHFTGETAQFFQWKNEPDHPVLYRRIDDSLRTEEAQRDQYCLCMESDGTYPLIAYHKMVFPPKLSYVLTKDYTNRRTLGISVKGESVSIPEGAYLRFRAEIRSRKRGSDPRFTKGEPTIGAHHAVQWSTSPHDTDEKN